MDDSFCFLRSLSVETAPTLLFFLNKISNFVSPQERDFTTASFMSPFIYLLRDMSGHRGRPTTTGKSHNKCSNTYSSTRGSESVPKKVKTSNKTIQSFLKSSQQEVEQNVVKLSDSLQTDTQIIENDSIEYTETDHRYESASTELDILTDEPISSPKKCAR